MLYFTQIILYTTINTTAFTFPFASGEILYLKDSIEFSNIVFIKRAATANFIIGYRGVVISIFHAQPQRGVKLAKCRKSKNLFLLLTQYSSNTMVTHVGYNLGYIPMNIT